MNFRDLIINTAPKCSPLAGLFGIERETQRITAAGKLATTPHPASFGSRAEHPYIQTDFSETQLELITPVCPSIAESLRYLSAIHDVVWRTLPPDERLWPLSMPPDLPADEKKIVLAQLRNRADVAYREQLSEKYGRRKQMVSGIHFNFEFTPAWLQQLFSMQRDYADFHAFTDALYLKIARNYLRSSWLITYLFGASPESGANYFGDAAPALALAKKPQPLAPMRSVRASRFGYHNFPEVEVSFTSVAAYTDDLLRLVDSGVLIAPKEFYSPIRLRHAGGFEKLRTQGITYLEIRNLDVNPFSPLGVDKMTLQFVQLFLLYMLWEDTDATADEQRHGRQRAQNVASENPTSVTAAYAAGQKIFAGMLAMARELDLLEVIPVIENMHQRLNEPSLTPAAQLLTASAPSTRAPQNFATQLAASYFAEAHVRPYQLAGFTAMELSTQILLFDAIQAGVQVEILDEDDQMLRLTYQTQSEYVKNANMTARDSYIVPLIMANKTVTKKILAEAGFRVPHAQSFTTVQNATRAYPQFISRPVVIKPKSTNYGLGITIFPNGATEKEFTAGLALAFKEDSTVLVEDFLPGTEYRFLVIAGRTVGVILRQPAQVVGDGQKTIAELVAQKNSNPLRGTDHRAPLEKIQLGEIERLMLAGQGFDFSTVLASAQIALLRENSNISTGGDSYDLTATMPASYKKIAEAATHALGATICGIDLIIPDLAVDPATDHHAYGIIEANFNPAMHMHVYPEHGPGERVTQAVLHLLFPQLIAD